ncbi:MAG: TraE family protein, partial [Eubacteriales bacterium]|nr:TraE family protein [Eubacteriales bacterium]
MNNALTKLFKPDRERFTVPRGVQSMIPIRRIWPDGIFLTGDTFTKSFRFTDINYAVASREEKEAMFLAYSEVLNSLDTGSTTKITIINRRLNRADFEKTLLLAHREDGLDALRDEYNNVLIDKATGG